MTEKLMRIARMALKLLLIELLVPGGTLVVLALFLTGSSALAVPEKVAAFLPFLPFVKPFAADRGEFGCGLKP
jgi:hypothetical protein